MPEQGTTAPRGAAQRTAGRRASEATCPAEEEALERALAPVKEALRRVDDRILAQLTNPVARIVAYLITAGGKRLRPALVLLAGAAGASPNREALIDGAAAVELIHSATLIHDDIIDGSPLRRRQPTFHHQWGMERAVLMGDYLYATAFTLLARLKSPSVVQMMADVCRQLCRGELREVEARYRLDLSEDEYLDIIRDKTASLIGACCASGAILGGCPPAAVDRLTRFGINFGIAFQIIDDCLDLTGDPRALGKSIHADLDKGTLSLPIIYLTHTLPARERDRLFAPLRSSAPQRAGRRADHPAFLARVANAARASGSIARAQDRARALIRAAEEALAGVPLNGLAMAYRELAAYAVSRRA